MGELKESQESAMYIGCKIIKAKPMLVGEAVICGYKTGTSALTDNGYEVEYEDGYKSWSPKDVFERSYRKLTVSEVNMIVNNNQ